ncbi:MAG: hypothetical protein E4H09_03350 [Spirochaetales bacterium]|nr:MAG: hypothetical protein E4H09_03350 [Spirochaetales bacterium]
MVQRRSLLGEKQGGDSVMIRYLGVDLPASYFAKISTGHFFFTPRKSGLSSIPEQPSDASPAGVKAWFSEHLNLTTYEIGIPALRDPSLAGDGKTGMTISILFDYEITRAIHAAGWHREFKEIFETTVIDILNDSVYPGLKAAVQDRFSATPVSMARIAGTTHGAITGWAFTNEMIPAEHRLTGIANAARTPVSHVSQAGQWTYTPAGFPIAILTGKVAADRVGKSLGRGTD